MAIDYIAVHNGHR